MLFRTTFLLLSITNTVCAHQVIEKFRSFFIYVSCFLAVCDAGDLLLSYNNSAPNSYAEEYLVDAVVSYSCDDGYSGCVTATCLSNREWEYSGACDIGNEPPLMTFSTEVERITL